jgi:hypothetical protein
VNLPARIVALHRALETAEIPHAFGGALALAWCTQQARGTIDIDLNLFVAPDRTDEVLAALPAGVTWGDRDRTAMERDGQVRLWWEETPVDLFFNTTEFHERLATRTQRHPFLDAELPFLSCRDLAVFKAFFNRTRDWADLEDMAAAGALDVEAVLGVLANYLGGDDDRVARLRALGRAGE